MIKLRKEVVPYIGTWIETSTFEMGNDWTVSYLI